MTIQLDGLIRSLDMVSQYMCTAQEDRQEADRIMLMMDNMMVSESLRTHELFSIEH